MIRVVLLAVLLVPRSAFAACETILATDSSKVSKAGDTMTGSLTNNYGFIGSLTGNVTGNCSGNAGTVTNGVYTTGSYSDPAWITSLNGSKLTAGSVDTTKIGSGTVTVNAIASGAVDTDKIGSGAITVNKMAASAVDTSKIAAGAVDTTKAKCLNGAGCFIATDSSGRYPPLDGSQITGISGAMTGLTSGFVPHANSATSIVNGNLFETSTGTSINLPFTFNSTTTVGAPNVQVSTLSYAAVVNGGWAICASTQPSSQIQVNFVNFRSSYTYEVDYNINDNTSAGAVTVQLNGDTGSNYKWADQNIVSSGTNGVSGGNSDTAWHLQRVQSLAGEQIEGYLRLKTSRGNGGHIQADWNSSGQIDATNTSIEYGGGRYVGTSLTSLQFQINGGTMSGWIDVYCKYVGGH